MQHKNPIGKHMPTITINLQQKYLVRFIVLLAHFLFILLMPSLDEWRVTYTSCFVIRFISTYAEMFYYDRHIKRRREDQAVLVIACAFIALVWFAAIFLDTRVLVKYFWDLRRHYAESISEIDSDYTLIVEVVEDQSLIDVVVTK